MVTQEFGYIDVNPDPTGNGYGDLLYGEAAVVVGSIRNMFACPIGDRGRIFQPTYGTWLYQLLQEPLDAITAHKIEIALIQSIQNWEPRIEILAGLTSVNEDYQLPGYLIVVGFRMVGMDNTTQASFAVPQGGI